MLLPVAHFRGEAERCAGRVTSLAVRLVTGIGAFEAADDVIQAAQPPGRLAKALQIRRVER